MTTVSYYWQRLKPFFYLFIVAELFSRLALTFYAWGDIRDSGAHLFSAFGVGFVFDLAVFIYFAIPVAFLAYAIPQAKQGGQGDKIISASLFFVLAYIFMFTSIGEWFFWDEFQSRYNFIAVDYLVYTQEVIGNIRESYPVGLLMSAMAAAASLLTWFYVQYTFGKKIIAPTSRQRLGGFATIIAIALVSFFSLSTSMAEVSANRYLNEIARNGFFELFSAFRNNALDYDRFYASHPLKDVTALLQEKLHSQDASAASPLIHAVKLNSTGQKYNLVLITVESLSAEFLKTFGNKDNITPYLDDLTDQSLFFSNLYATGTRTVYGLSALTLAVPPVPGNSIVRRPENGNLFSLGSVLKSQGYATKFIYGGFGYFDNMNEFFGNNGYEIVDRSNLKSDEIHFANVWGVADDDLYARTLKENDKAYEQGKPFFDMLMTTSNHRPFTYPDGKIDIPSKTGRKGGVKYTDYTIQQFLAEAKKRPWFDKTIFVIVADHTAGSSGKSELDPRKYHIPMWIYAPSIIKPAKVDWMASQIDVAPTILGLMGVSYQSQFYGKDLMKEKPERAFISNYQKLGYLTPEGLVILKPIQQAQFYKRDGDEFKAQPQVPENMMNEAVAYYQGASQWKNWSRQAPTQQKSNHLVY